MQSNVDDWNTKLQWSRSVSNLQDYSVLWEVTAKMKPGLPLVDFVLWHV